MSVAIVLRPLAIAACVVSVAAAQATESPAPLDSRIKLEAGFRGERIAEISGARQLATLPNGDLLVGTTGRDVYLVPHADAAGAAGKPHVFITLPEAPAHSIAYAPNGSIYAATNTTVWKIAYSPGAQTAADATAIAHVRTGPVAPHSDGDVHRTTTVVATAKKLYVGVGSSCNACVEADGTRATIQEANLDGSDMHTLATRIRNPIALTVNSATNEVWAAGAGQDAVAYGHPYEFLDSPTLHREASVDYGWPQCEENHHAYNALGVSPAPNCAKTVEPAVEFPAYATFIGAAFYPEHAALRYAFPERFHGGVFLAAHGSWHCCPSTQPRVYFVPMHGDVPARPVDWSDPTRQSESFVSGFGTPSSSSYFARPTGIAIGKEGSLFIGDDRRGAVYRIRPVSG